MSGSVFILSVKVMEQEELLHWKLQAQVSWQTPSFKWSKYLLASEVLWSNVTCFLRFTLTTNPRPSSCYLTLFTLYYKWNVTVSAATLCSNQLLLLLQLCRWVSGGHGMQSVYDLPPVLGNFHLKVFDYSYWLQYFFVSFTKITTKVWLKY